MSGKVRLDTLLAERGVFDSRSRAAGAVLAGDVAVGPGMARASKPGMLVEPDAEISVRERRRYVSRGGLKLERALRCFGIPVEGRFCLDVGASTGGFTDCLLRAGAAHVVALDVAYGALDWALRGDPRVTAIERRNARSLGPGDLPYAPDLIVVDVSFIGLGKVMPALVECAASEFDLVSLVKPQFEVGRERVGSGGVVRDAGDRLRALVSVGEAARRLRLSVQGYCESGLPGPAGNRESFIWCTEAGRPGNEDLVRAASRAEPEAKPGGSEAPG